MIDWRSNWIIVLILLSGCSEQTPFPNSDSIMVLEDASAEVDLLVNDCVPKGKLASVTIANHPKHGTATLLGAGRVRYSPQAHYHGSDKFEYLIEIQGKKTIGAVVSVDVSHVNHAPVAHDDTIQVYEGTPVTWSLAKHSSDIDGDSLKVLELQAPTNGTVTTDGNVVVYTPAPKYYGEDFFTCTASDGSLSSNVVTVSVQVLPAAPRFWDTERSASLNEMLQEPGSSVYGSSINIWTYEDANGLFDQIVVTGHADSSTCRNVSGLLFNAFLQKHREPEDLLVAGTGLLKMQLDIDLLTKVLKTEPVQNYVKCRRGLQLAKEVLQVVETQASTSEDGESAITRAKEEIARSEKSLADAAKPVEVQQYLAQIQSPNAMNRFVEDARRIAGETGLVRIHRLDGQLATKASHRIDVALQVVQDSGYVRFDDLAKLSPDGNAVAIVPVRDSNTNQPLVLELPLAKLDPNELEKLREESQQEITFAMVGNAKGRLEYLIRKRNESADSLATRQKDLMKLSPAKLAAARKQLITLGITITPDGEFKSERATTITLGEYVDFRLPANLKLFDHWIAETRELLDSIARDMSEGDGSAIKHISFCTMIDSMLRDWNLPVSRSQNAFDQWRAAQRQPVWDILIELLELNGIRKDSIGGENVVFSVSLVDERIVIKPLHIVDMKNSILLIDKQLGVTRVVDAWGERKVVQVGSSVEEARDRDQKARLAMADMHSALQACDRNAAQRHWHLALDANARIAVQMLLDYWSSEFPENILLNERLRNSVAPKISSQELISEWERINSDPRYKEDDKQGDYLLAKYRFLEGNPEAPPELYFRFILDLSDWIALTHKDLSGEDVTRWDVLRTLTGAVSSNTEVLNHGFQFRWTKSPDEQVKSVGDSDEADELKEGSFYLARKKVSEDLLSGEDPANLLKVTLARARKMDPEFVDGVLKRSKMPNELSMAYRRLIQQTNGTLTEFEFDSYRLERVRQMMKSRANADMAATLLCSETNPPLNEILNYVQESLRSQMGSQNSAFRVVQEKLKNAISLGKGTNRLELAEIVGNLEHGKRLLLNRSENDLKDESRRSGLRDIALLHARLRFENGQYNTSIENLFETKVALALYHPALDWTALPDDWIGSPLAVRAEVNAGGGILVIARRPKEKQVLLTLPIELELDPFKFDICFDDDQNIHSEQILLRLIWPQILYESPAWALVRRVFQSQNWKTLGFASGPRLAYDDSSLSIELDSAERDCDILKITNVPDETCNYLMKEINSVRSQDWTTSARVSEQILLKPIEGRPVLAAFRELFHGKGEREGLIKAMVYGSVVPAAEAFPGSGRWLETSRSRMIYDRILTNGAGSVQVPSLTDIIRKVESGEVTQNILPRSEARLARKTDSLLKNP